MNLKSIQLAYETKVISAFFEKDHFKFYPILY